MTTAAQQRLIDAIARVLERDARVEAVWLAGSLGRGMGDAFSDVDVLVLCADGKAGETSAAYVADVSKIATPVLTNPLFGGRVLNVVTEDWERFDLTFIEGQQLARYNAADLTALFNRSGREPPRTPRAPHRTSPGDLRKLVNEFYRVLGLAVVGAGREEYLLGLWGIQLLRQMTVDLMIEENGIGPAERGGALHLNRLLRAEQRQLLESMAAFSATRESVLQGQQEFARLFLPRAKALAASIGMEWPDALEAATRRHLKTHLGMEI